MEPLFYVMAILGCADGATQCQESRLAAVRFESRAQCEAAIEVQLSGATDIGFPTIAARCVSGKQYVAQSSSPREARLKLASLQTAN